VYALSVHGSAVVYAVILVTLLMRDDERASDAVRV
jgi:hypothetical protein